MYLPLLIQRATTAGGSFSESLVYEQPFDTKERFGLWIKHAPFTILPKPKNIVSQVWKDQDGEDVFIPETITHEAYDMKLEFVYMRNDGMALENIRNFINEIEGRWLKMYESYTRQGRQALYLSATEDEPTYRRRDTNNLVIFSATFRVNDPDTVVTLN